MSKINGIGIGVSYGNSSGTGGLLNSSTFFAPLKTSLILQRGTGDPTWSRDTKAWGFNELGYLEELASGCAFFGGARLVRNTVRTTSEDFSNAAWVKSNCTVTGTNTIVCANATSLQRISQDISGAALVTGMKMFYSFRVAYVSGGASFIQITGTTSGFGSGQHANFSLLDGTYSAVGCTASSSLVSPGVYDFSIAVTATATANQDAFYACFVNDLATARFASFTGDGVKSFQLLRAWSVDVTNYDASYVPEYVSVGVASAPFPAGIDGAKYFETDWQGAPIAAANLLGFRREAAATNNLRQSRNLTVHHAGSVSTKRWQSTTPVGAEVVLNSSFDSGLTNWATTIGSGGSISVAGGQCTFVSDGGTATFMTNAATLTVGSTYVLETIATGTGSVKLVSGAQEIAGFGTGTTTISFVAVSTGITIYRLSGTPCNIVFDSISIKLSSVQCSQTATGLDGIANTATTLTATAADATILQPITLASAARCASAYVKRRTGTGTISFTQDGGSTWTDITSLINGSTWSRVQITSTLANPSVGFKIGTSGDAIDVDCVQNEAGAEATSPIVTTTATVTRNADSLSYQTASNIDFAVGTLYHATKLTGSSTSRYPVIIGSSHLGINSSQANTEYRAYDGTTVVSKLGLDDATAGFVKRASSWGSAGLKVTGNGAVTASGAFDGSFGDGATISIASNLSGYVGPIAIWNYQMTDAQLQAITL